MKKIFATVFFCTSFFSYAAEAPMRATRTKDLGDTGAEIIPPSGTLHKKTSIGHALRRMSSPERGNQYSEFSRIENLVLDGKDWNPGRRIGDVSPTQDQKS